jgi:hypothetical protein
MIRSLSVLSAGVVALAVSGAANADNDLMRLDGKGDAEVQETRYYGGGFRGGIGYGGGFRGGIGYGGYRGFGGYGRGYGGYYGRGFGYGGYGRGYGYAGSGRAYDGGYGARPAYGLGLGRGVGLGAATDAGGASADNDLMRLDGKGDAEVQETRYGGGGFRGGVGFGGYRGGYRGGYGGYRGFGGYYGRGYGGYGRGYGYGYGRGYYGGYYRPYYGFGYGLGLGLGYASYYGGYGGGYGGAYGSYYSTPYYSSSYGLCPCATNTNFPSATTSLFTPNGSQAPWDGTFPYNGGPQDGYFAPAPAGMPNRTNAPRDGHLVSVPASSSSYHFLAFGEQSAPADQRPATANSGDLLRVSYPAYGEAPSGFSGGTTIYPAMTR